jgi:hypothetical protein
MNDDMLPRTLTLLLRSYPAANPFWLARLAGRNEINEIEVAAALAEIEREGLAESNAGLSLLTPAGRDQCRPAHVSRPPSPARLKPLRPRRQGGAA